MDLNKLDIKRASIGLKNRDFSSLELTEAFFAKIEQEDQKIDSFLFTTKDLALRQAKKVDARIAKREKLSVLAGIPMSVKDNILVRGEKNTCASKMLKNYIAPYDATAIVRLKKEGAVILGKTNLDEFAMGSSTENSAFKTTKNPLDLTRVPGGSSGGPAASVAADLAIYSLCSDTGGSIRQPASFCGVVGFKPTYGAVSRYGLVAFASSLDQIGTITKTVADAEIVFKAISGIDPNDSTSVDLAKIERKKNGKIKMGVPKEYFSSDDYQTKEIVKKAITEKGFELVDISLPNTKYALAVYYIIMPSEASSNLSRFDGIKYGLHVAGDDLLGSYLKTKGTGFGDEVKRRIMLGTYSLSAGYYDAYYLQAQKVRNLIKQDFAKAFEKVDAIFAPTTPTVAFKIGEKADDPLAMYLEDIFTVSVNLAGLPAISVPVGNIDNLPVGLQIIGKHFREDVILKIAKNYV